MGEAMLRLKAAIEADDPACVDAALYGVGAGTEALVCQEVLGRMSWGFDSSDGSQTYRSVIRWVVECGAVKALARLLEARLPESTPDPVFDHPYDLQDRNQWFELLGRHEDDGVGGHGIDNVFVQCHQAADQQLGDAMMDLLVEHVQEGHYVLEEAQQWSPALAARILAAQMRRRISGQTEDDGNLPVARAPRASRAL